jgi:hypothetical protein
MSTKTGDLVPFGSGASHLGVDGGNAPGSFVANSMVPFGHVVQLSGVWVDPIQGTSGIIRFDQAAGAFETSVDGGITFTAIGSDVMLSGVLGVNGINVDQVAGDFIVNGSAVSGLINLQQAYDGGDQIMLSLLGNENRTMGVIVAENDLNESRLRNLGLENDAYSIMVSGYSTNPNSLTSSYSTRIASNGIAIQESGFANFHPNRLTLGFVSQTDPLLDDTQRALIRAEGTMQVIGSSGLNVRGKDFNATIRDDLLLETGTLGFEDGKGQITLSPWGGSGVLTYEFGPFESWYVGSSRGGSHPIAHSGQVTQMIEENSINKVNAGSGPEVTIDGANGISVVTVDNTHTISAVGLSGELPTINGETGPAITLSGVNNVVITPSGNTNVIGIDTALSRKGLKQGLQIRYSTSGTIAIGPGRIHTVDSNGAHRILENDASFLKTVEPMISGWKYVYVEAPLDSDLIGQAAIQLSTTNPILDGKKRGYYLNDGRCLGAIRLADAQIIPFATNNNIFTFTGSVFERTISLNNSSGVIDLSEADDGAVPVYTRLIEASLLNFRFAAIPNLIWHAGAGANVVIPPPINTNSGGLERGLIFSSARNDTSLTMTLPVFNRQGTLYSSANASIIFCVYGHEIPPFIADTVG